VEEGQGQEADGLAAVAQVDEAGIRELPTTVASTSRRRARSMKASTLDGGTARLIRSWDSETQISQGERPAYLRGQASRSTVTPPEPSAISPSEEERPPAPLSVMAAYSPGPGFQEEVGHFLWMMGSPICTAVTGLDSRAPGWRRCAVDAVLADAPAEHDGLVAGLTFFSHEGAPPSVAA
jgi:hypothetical protein